MITIGSHNTLPVLRREAKGLVLGSREAHVLLPSREAPAEAAIGERLRVFVYTDSEDRPVATTRTPHATVGEFACLEVVDVSTHGAFLGWGLDKDLFVPFREQHRRMEVGRRYVVAVALDERSGRVIGSSRLGQFLDYDVSGLQEGQAVTLLVYDFNEHGAQVIVDDRYSGLVYANDTFRPLRTGDETSGYIQHVRPDNKVDVSLRRLGHDGTLDAQAAIVRRLQAAGGYLPVHDKCSPQEIARVFAMSKKTFKKALGGLYKAGTIELSDHGTKLVG